MLEMTKDELRDMIQELIDQRLFELLGDPDEGWEVRKPVREKLLRQMTAVAEGERGEALEDVVGRLGLG
jgi:hypothetical protein